MVKKGYELADKQRTQYWDRCTCFGASPLWYWQVRYKSCARIRITAIAASRFPLFTSVLPAWIPSARALEGARWCSSQEWTEHGFRSVVLPCLGADGCNRRILVTIPPVTVIIAATHQEGANCTRRGLEAFSTSAQPRLQRLRDNLKAKQKPGNSSYQWMRNRWQVTGNPPLPIPAPMPLLPPWILIAQ